MNAIAQPTETRRLTIALRENTCVGEDERVAESVRRLPGVLRVRANPQEHEIEITVQYPTDGLLQGLNAALKSHSCEVAAGRVR